MHIPRSAVAIAMITVAAVLSACGGGNSDDTARADPAQACAALVGFVIPAARIALPTTGASVTSAALQAASGTGLAAKPEHCKVLAQVAPIDPGAQPIRMQLNLPSAWNEKALQMGGGGYDGVLVTADGAATGANGQPSPLANGYATFGSDGGHSASNFGAVEEHVAAFLNDEVLVNYAGAQLKKTRDVAVALIQERYGKAPRRTYFIGGSAGGREALLVTQKFGADYDGSIAYYPAAGGMPLLLNLGRVSRALAAPGAYPNPAKQALLHGAVVAACDAADGAADGIVSNAAACSFSVAVLRCPSGGDDGDTCLSDPQIAALDALELDFQVPYSLASGETGIRGYDVYKGVNLAAPGSGLGVAAPVAMPSAFAQPAHDWLYDIFLRGILTRDPGANSLLLDPEAPGVYQPRINFLSTLVQASNPDLSTFQRRGGKLIIVHGKDDALIPVAWSEDYFKKVVQTMGAATADGFMRYYSVPGYGHGSGSFIVDWNSLAALDDWVEKGISPTDPVAADIHPANGGRTRPLCRYPNWPRYQGSGSINAASSYSCVPS